MRKNNFIARGKGRKVGPVLHIFCEGETEEAYLKAYKRYHKYSSCEIEHPQHTDPVGIVKEAIKTRKETPSSDSHWVAYDLEDISLDNRRHVLEKAHDMAQGNDIHIALSAISFEVWLLLHFTDTPQMYHNCSAAVRALKKHLPDYTKGDAKVFVAIQQYLQKARENAATLKRRQERNAPDRKPYEHNPYTSFHLLLDAIDEIK